MDSNTKTVTEYPFPVYGTQGGGLVREVTGKFIFVESPPKFPELTVGSELPEHWDFQPANKLAEEKDEEDFWTSMKE